MIYAIVSFFLVLYSLWRSTYRVVKHGVRDTNWSFRWLRNRSLNITRWTFEGIGLVLVPSPVNNNEKEWCTFFMCLICHDVCMYSTSINYTWQTASGLVRDAVFHLLMDLVKLSNYKLNQPVPGFLERSTIWFVVSYQCHYLKLTPSA